VEEDEVGGEGRWRGEGRKGGSKLLRVHCVMRWRDILLILHTYREDDRRHSMSPVSRTSFTLLAWIAN